MKKNYNKAAMSDMAIVAEVCKNLQKMRLQANMTQQEMAQRAGLDRTTISRMESGRSVTLLTVVQVLRVLGKLEILDAFETSPTLSPLQELQLSLIHI